MDKKVSRKELLTEAQMAMIQTTGKISGEVKDIIICDNKDKMLEGIENINNNLKELVLEIRDIANALNLDFNEIIGGKNGDNT